LKIKLTNEEHGALADSVKELYKKSGDNYILDVDIKESPDYIALLGNRNTVLDEKKAEEKKRKSLEDENEKTHIANLEEKQEYEKLLDIKTEKFKTDIKSANDKIIILQKQLENTLLDSAVESMSIKLAGDSAELIKPHLKNRLVMKDVDGQLKLFVTDVTGTASAMTLDQLSKEFEENNLYAPIISGRQSSGGGAGGDGGSSSGAATDYAVQEAYFKPESRNLTKQSELLQIDPELYKKLSDKYGTQGRARMFKQVG
jgi:hypothetical protein